MVPADPRTPFDTPVHVVRPRLPDLEGFVERLRTIWASGWLTNGGAQHIELELRLQQMLGVSSLSLFNNGTMALLTACRALSLHGEVITTPFTFPATPHVLSWLGATPVFADIDRATLTIDPDRIEALITPRTTGILAVHVYGTPCDVDRLEDIARRHRLKLVYDAAHAFGVRVGGRGIGTFGDASAFSFHATKVFHTAEGGALACSDPELAAHAALLRNFGIRSEEEVELPGLNGKMNELQAALGLSVLDDLADEWRARLRLSAVYRDALADLPGLALPGPAAAEGGLLYYVIRVDGDRFGCSRDELQRRLRELNVFTRKYFYPLCSDYPCYRHLASAAPSALPVAREAAGQVLCLPLHAGVAPEQAAAIGLMIRSFAAEGIAAGGMAAVSTP